VDLLALSHLLESSVDLFDAALLLQREEVEVLVEQHLVILLEVSEQLGFVGLLSFVL